MKKASIYLLVAVAIALPAGYLIVKKRNAPQEPAISLSSPQELDSSRVALLIEGIIPANKSPESTVFSLSDLKTYWQLAPKHVPLGFSWADCSQEEKLDLFVAVLSLMGFLAEDDGNDTKPAEENLEIKYIKAVSAMSNNIIDLFYNKQYPVQLTKEVAEIAKERLLSTHSSYEIYRIILADKQQAESIISLITEEKPKNLLTLFKGMATEYSVTGDIEEKKNGGKFASKMLVNMPRFYRPALSSMSPGSMKLLKDPLSDSWHLLLLVDKQPLPLKYKLVEAWECNIPLLNKQDRDGQPSSSEEDTAREAALRDELFNLVSDPSFNPQEDKKHIWVKRSVKIVDHDDLSVDLPAGANWSRMLVPWVDFFDYGFIRKLSSQLPGDVFAVPLQDGLLRPGAFIGPNEMKVNNLYSLKLIYVSKVTEVDDDPEFVKEFLVQQLLLIDEPLRKLIMKSITKQLKSNCSFLIDRQRILAYLEA